MTVSFLHCIEPVFVYIDLDILKFKEKNNNNIHVNTCVINVETFKRAMPAICVSHN